MARSKMDEVAGVDRRPKFQTAKPPKLLFTAREVSAVLGVNEKLFAQIVRDGHVAITRLPGSGEKELRRYSLASLRAAVAAMTTGEGDGPESDGEGSGAD